MTVVTRFAPSPTGFLHIGGARTALFNWLYAKRHGGKFMLRVEDTDRKRSTEPAIEAILDGLRWLELDWDDEPVFQFARIDRHVEVAEAMLASGHAYKCYATNEELADLRAAAQAENKRFLYDGRWRDRDPSEAPEGVKPAIRLKAPRDGETVVNDLVQGEVRVANAELDDMVLLRADGTPTYMLAVVVDDHDMNVSHVIRGDDHLNNTFRQVQVFKAMGWALPAFAHIPLIHGADGAKLSKRHGALGVDTYRDMGLLPDAIRNYLLRLGWSHGDLEIVSTEEAIKLFDLEGVGRSPSRFDMAKLENTNGHYMREAEPETLTTAIASTLETKLGRSVTDIEAARLHKGMPSLQQRAKTLLDLAQNAEIYLDGAPFSQSAKAAKALGGADASAGLAAANAALSALSPETWSEAEIEAALRAGAESAELKLGKLAQPLRAALTGSDASPSLFEVAAILGRDETLRRSEAAL
jgi:glutamyl-tRNA synthetase